MFQEKRKALTFSFDDGLLQDRRLVALFNKYGMKCTFNLNSGRMGSVSSFEFYGNTVESHVLPESEVRELYRGHEIASHTLTHPALNGIPDDEVIRQVEEDRKKLSEIVGYEVTGFVYPSGAQSISDRTLSLLREKTGVKYARTCKSSYNFDTPQKDLLLFQPTVHTYSQWDRMEALADEFIALTPDEPKLFYIWGHAFEFDFNNGWERFETLLSKLAHREDIFYGTNREVLLK